MHKTEKPGRKRWGPSYRLTRHVHSDTEIQETPQLHGGTRHRDKADLSTKGQVCIWVSYSCPWLAKPRAQPCLNYTMIDSTVTPSLSVFYSPHSSCLPETSRTVNDHKPLPPLPLFPNLAPVPTHLHPPHPPHRQIWGHLFTPQPGGWKDSSCQLLAFILQQCPPT